MAHLSDGKLESAFNTCEARHARSACVQSTPIDITYILLNRLTVSHETENSWSVQAEP